MKSVYEVRGRDQLCAGLLVHDEQSGEQVWIPSTSDMLPNMVALWDEVSEEDDAGSANIINTDVDVARERECDPFKTFEDLVNHPAVLEALGAEVPEDEDEDEEEDEDEGIPYDEESEDE